MLAAQAADGHRASFTALVQLTQQPLFRRAFVQMNTQAEAEDVVQEVMIQAWKSLPQLRDPQAAWSWLCQMSYNVARDHRRKLKRKTKNVSLNVSLETQEFLEAWQHTSDLTPEKEMLSKELSSLVKQAIEALDEKHSVILRLREFGHFSYEEIAEMLGCSQSTVESRLHRARLKLKQQLQKLFANALER